MKKEIWLLKDLKDLMIWLLLLILRLYVWCMFDDLKLGKGCALSMYDCNERGGL